MTTTSSKPGTVELRHGSGGKLAFALSQERRVAIGQGPVDAAAVDVGEAVLDALAEPADYPPLSKCVVPGDRVAVAVEPGLVCSTEVVAAIVTHLKAARLSDCAVAVLCANESDRRRLALGGVGANGELADVQLVSHDASHASALGYLSNTENGRGIWLNRELCDADVLVAVSATASDLTWGNHGAYGAIYPSFADADVRRRMNRPGPRQVSRQAVDRARAEADRVGWLLGEPFSIYLVPGVGGGWHRVFAGGGGAAFTRARECHAANWTVRAASEANLVVATLSGGVERQTWAHVGRAAEAAARLVEPDGTIALVTELVDEPSESVRHLGEARSVAAAIKRLARERPDDAQAAAGLARALVRARVYLVSKLDAEVVEGLGMVHVDDPRDIERLATRHATTALLADADRAVIERADAP